jgi:hypothetical protein
MDCFGGQNLINYVKGFNVPKKQPKLEDMHILLPIQNIKTKEDESYKKHKKRKVSSVSKPNLKNSVSNKHKNYHGSTKDLFHPQNLNNDIECIEGNKKKIISERENNGKLNYNEILDEMKEKNALLKEEISNKEKEIMKYKERYQEQKQLIKELQSIFNDMKSNENLHIDLRGIESNNNTKDNINLNNNYEEVEQIIFDEGYQEELAIKAVEQQIIDDLCPNPDAMTYEQLLDLEDNVGKVNRGLNIEQFDKLPLKKYRKEKFKGNYQCIICMEEFIEKEKVKLLPCGHIFHINCIKQWLLKEKNCPFCKSEIG